MITLESVLNNEFEQYYSQEYDDEYNVEAVELAESMNDVNIAFESVNAFSCALAVMESANYPQTVQMEGFVDAIKNFFKKIKEALKKFWAFITGPFRNQTKNVDNAIDKAIDDAAKNEKENNISDSDIEEACDAGPDINSVKERNPKISIYSIPYDLRFTTNDDIENVKYFKYEDNSKLRNYTKEEKKELKTYTLQKMGIEFDDYIDGATQIYLDISKYIADPKKLIDQINNPEKTDDTMKYLLKRLNGSSEQHDKTRKNIDTLIKNLTARRTYIVSKKGVEQLKKRWLGSGGIKDAAKELEKTCETFKKDMDTCMRDVDKLILNDDTKKLEHSELLSLYTKSIRETSTTCAKITSTFSTIQKRLCAAMSMNTKLMTDKKYRKEHSA